MRWLFLAHFIDVDNSIFFVNVVVATAPATAAAETLEKNAMAKEMRGMWIYVENKEYVYIEMVFGIWTIKSYFAILWIIAIVQIVENIYVYSVCQFMSHRRNFNLTGIAICFFPRLCHWNANGTQAAKVHQANVKQQNKIDNAKSERTSGMEWKGMKVSPRAYMLYANAWCFLHPTQINVYL